MVGLACAVTMGILLFGHARFSAGFALGSALAILSYFWLHQIVEALMSAGQTRPPKRVLAKVFVRYPLAFAAVYLFYRTGWLPATAIVAGLFVPVGGVVIESALLIRHGLKTQD